ncbi:MAG: DUF116 domain-containing protein [Methanobacteriaceae archaeon]|nr:DUF116 domain-containing protein [Methanobacteriaceae archaeon]
MFEILFNSIGKIVLFILSILIIIMIITLILGRHLLKNGKIIFPNILLFTLDISYGLLKRICELVNIDSTFLDNIGIDLQNNINKEKFKHINPEDIILVLPHCLRGMNCPATLGTSGLECIKCNKCDIGKIKEVADKKNMKLFITPGSSFIKNIVKNTEFKGVIGVACPHDLNAAMTNLSTYTCQGVYLLKEGCINTRVNVNEVIDLMNIAGTSNKPKK